MYVNFKQAFSWTIVSSIEKTALGMLIMVAGKQEVPVLLISSILLNA